MWKHGIIYNIENMSHSANLSLINFTLNERADPYEIAERMWETIKFMLHFITLMYNV